MWWFSPCLHLSFLSKGDPLKVVYPICYGIDVHKSFLVGTIIVWFLKTIMLLGGINTRQQWIYRKEEVCSNHTCRSLSQTYISARCTATVKSKESLLLPSEIWEYLQTQRQKTGNHRHCKNDSHCDLFHDVYWCSLESYRPCESGYVGISQEKMLSKSMKQVTKFLQNQGLTVL